MRKFFAVAGVTALKIWREKTFLLIMLATAVCFSAAAGLFLGTGGTARPVQLAVADMDGSDLSKRMISDLASSGAYSVRVVSSESLYEDVREGSVEAGFVIPSGFKDSLTSGSLQRVTVVSLANSNTGAVAGTIMEKSLTSYLLEQAVVSITLSEAEGLGVRDGVDPAIAVNNVREQLANSPALTVTFEEVREDPKDGSEVNWTAQYSAGIYIMFTMFTVVFQGADILRERETGTWGRILSTPVSRWSLIGGKALGSYGVGLLQVLVLLLFGRYVLKTNYGHDFFAVILILALMVAAATALGLFLSTLVRTSAQLYATAPVVIVASCMLGGCYWPLEVVSPLMQTIAKITPQAWAMTAFNDVVVRGRSLASTTTNLVVLAGFGLGLLALGAFRTKLE